MPNHRIADGFGCWDVVPMGVLLALILLPLSGAYT